MTRSKIFITGIAGFLGSHLAERLINSGHTVSGCDNMLGGYRDNVPEGAAFHEVDARNFPKMKELLKGIDVVYHCAAAPHEGLSVFSPNLITEHTYNSTVATVTAAVINNVKRVVFCSSMARYGHQGKEGGIFNEEMPARPVDPYGVAKYASELFLETMSQAHGTEYVVAVPHNIFGPKQKYDDPYRNVISIVTNRMLQGQQPIIYGDGEQKRSFTYITDAIDPLVKMGFNKDVVGHAINIGPDEEFVTINHAAKTIADILNFKLDPIYVPSRPQEVKYASCSADKVRRMLGYKTTTSFKDGVKETVKWIKSRGAKPFEYHLDLEIVNDRTPETWKNKLI
ncbi:MAG: NAD-dependent epimerase/dehydratase family protein [Patescibacteria group bacterium]